MKRTDFSQNGGFPLTQDRLNDMQNAWTECQEAHGSVVGAAAVSGVILSGCVVHHSGTYSISAGYIYCVDGTGKGQVIRVAAASGVTIVGGQVPFLHIYDHVTLVNYNDGGGHNSVIDRYAILAGGTSGSSVAGESLEISLMVQWADAVGITALGTDIAAIDAEITDINTALATDADNITTLEAAVDNINTHLTTLDGEITTIDSHLTTLDGKVANGGWVSIGAGGSSFGTGYSQFGSGQPVAQFKKNGMGQVEVNGRVACAAPSGVNSLLGTLPYPPENAIFCTLVGNIGGVLVLVPCNIDTSGQIILSATEVYVATGTGTNAFVTFSNIDLGGIPPYSTT